MPSLFSRSHQSSKKDRGPAVLVANQNGDRRLLGLAKTWNGQAALPAIPQNAISEFGTVASTPAGSTVGGHHGRERSHSVAETLPTSCAFLTTSIPITEHSILSSAEHEELRMYGYLGGVGKNIVLGVDEVARVIRDVGSELQRRALDTPQLFSNQSLELNQTRLQRLIKTYLATVRTPTRTPTKTSVETFQQDIGFASDYDLAWLLRWALSRMTRVREGTREVVHGCIDWDQYEEWRGRERSSKYPTDAFVLIGSILDDDIYKYIVNPIFSLLSKFAAHSHNSGLTPHALASYFAPLLFDIPTTTSYLAAHSAFVRAAAATEHLLLAYIRSSGDRDRLGVTDIPFRLNEWVKGYPSMIASDADLARGKPRRAARVVKCEVSTRSVRAYSRDLIVTAETWAQDMPNGWDAWDRVVLKTRRGEGGRPKFSPMWRRKMAVKETLPLPVSRVGGEAIVYGMPVGQDKAAAPPEEADAGRFGSLAGMEWNAFEEGGFDSPLATSTRDKVQKDDISSRLQFDLNESAKQSVAERRQTMDWTSFADGGFSRTEPFLTASLTFSAPVQTSITEWPKERDELRRRLHKTQKEATPFAHDTTPRVGHASQIDGLDQNGRITIEEAFVDCWTDFMMGSGWADREELTFKETSWALIEYRALPQHGDQYTPSGNDPRSSEVYFLFEERVPMEYQMAIADPKRKKTLATIFSRKKKQQQQSYDHRPRNDFDRMLDRGSQKKVGLTRSDQSVSSQLWNSLNDKPAMQPQTPTLPRSGTLKPTPVSKPAPLPKTPIKTHVPSAPMPLAKAPSVSPPMAAPELLRPDDSTKLGANVGGRSGIFKSVRRSKSGDQRMRKQREVSMEFDVQTASGLSSGTSSPQDTIHGAAEQDKWMDILVANGARKMDRDDTSPTPMSPTPKMGSPVREDSYGFPQQHPSPPGTGLRPPHPRDNKRASTGSLPVPSNRGSYQGSMESMASEPDPGIFGNNDFNSPERQQRFSAASSLTTYSTDDVMPSDSISVRRRPLPSPPRSDNPLPEPTTPPPARTSYDGLVSPRPRPAGERDALSSIVDRYDNPESELLYQRESQVTDTTDGDAYDGVVRESYIERTFASERANSAYSIEDDLRPPAPVFDLTPGREPSPARYKHGEPLHFVGEEEEYEYEFEQGNHYSSTHRF